MAASSFAEFDESKEDWLSYTERMQQYFVVNGVREDGQRTTLLSTCGPATYQLIKDLVAPEKLTYCEEVWRTCLVGEYTQDMQPSLIVQWFHFHSRGQMETRDHSTVCCHPQTTVDKLQFCRCFGRHATGSTSLWAAGCRATEEAIVRGRPYLPMRFWHLPGPWSGCEGYS